MIRVENNFRENKWSIKANLYQWAIPGKKNVLRNQNPSRQKLKTNSMVDEEKI